MPLFARRRAHHTTAPAPAHHHHHTTTTTTTTTRHRGLFGRRRPVHHHKRKTTMGDKISGALLKLKGSLTGRPGQKAAGTRRMHGTDGRGSHRHY
ncbi:hypothetical protein MAPG_09694 [Magnaporthiopsis poae ATCC 64411]|uniref:Uncharacterized protein n=1 Tax=Magnaporthiopsis poae (strain ATCC 64411 / 73-15) TaxID=644358 RepID=A0A0C4EAL9_MAGP6|nr:hypothetical protein MAPG_09694 [Magnaporthiopsis poae ATCC 64411]